MSPGMQCGVITLAGRTIPIWQQWCWQIQAAKVRAHLLPNAQQHSQAPVTAIWGWFLPKEQVASRNINHTEEYLYSLGTLYYH